MYSGVTITDSSYLVTVGYEIISLAIIFPLYLLSSKRFISFRHQSLAKLLVVFIVASVQYYFAKNGAGYIYQTFGYSAWDDTTIRFSSLAFIFIYTLFAADWGNIIGQHKKSKTKQN